MKTFLDDQLKRMGYGMLSVALIISVLSCEPGLNDESTMGVEREKIFNLLKKNGFVQIAKSQLRSGDPALPANVENKSFNTYAEAEVFVSALNAYDESALGNTVQRNVSGGRLAAGGKLMFVPCDDQGTFYINRATYGLFSDINVRFERDDYTNLTNITSNVSGLALYQWNQVGVNIQDQHNFCIDVNVVFGLDIAGLPTSWARQDKLRVSLDMDGSCHGYTQFGWGHC